MDGKINYLADEPECATTNPCPRGHKLCPDGSCVPIDQMCATTISRCGNGICESGENFINCPQDCGGDTSCKQICDAQYKSWDPRGALCDLKCDIINVFNWLATILGIMAFLFGFLSTYNFLRKLPKMRVYGLLVGLAIGTIAGIITYFFWWIGVLFIIVFMIVRYLTKSL